MDKQELTRIERAAILAWYLASGTELTTQQAADCVGLSHWAAWKLLCEISHRVEIYQDGYVWKKLKPR